MSRRAFLVSTTVPVLQGQDRHAKMFGNAEAYERFLGRWSRQVAPRLVDFAAVPEDVDFTPAREAVS